MLGRRREVDATELMNRIEQLSKELTALMTKQTDTVSSRVIESLKTLQAQIIALLDEQRAILADLVDLLQRQRSELEGSRAKLEDSVAKLAESNTRLEAMITELSAISNDLSKSLEALNEQLIPAIKSGNELLEQLKNIISEFEKVSGERETEFINNLK
ncbi:MAG: hypothetical protein QXE91_01645, partial [Thermofilaceae archaeon]